MSENSGYIEFYYNMDKSYEPEYADDIKTAVDSFEDRLSQKADTNHLKVILIGKTLRKDKAANSVSYEIQTIILQTQPVQ